MITFGLKKEVEGKNQKEKYDYPVLTLVALETPKSNRKLVLNTALVSLLGATKEDWFIVGEDDFKHPALVKVNEFKDSFPSNRVKQLAKNSNSFANKIDYDKIVDYFKLNPNIDNEILVNPSLFEEEIPSDEGKSSYLYVLLDSLIGVKEEENNQQNDVEDTVINSDPQLIFEEAVITTEEELGF